jgi:hypothetical protein
MVTESRSRLPGGGHVVGCQLFRVESVRKVLGVKQRQLKCKDCLNEPKPEVKY